MINKNIYYGILTQYFYSNSSPIFFKTTKFCRLNLGQSSLSPKQFVHWFIQSQILYFKLPNILSRLYRFDINAESKVITNFITTLERIRITAH